MPGLKITATTELNNKLGLTLPVTRGLASLYLLGTLAWGVEDLSGAGHDAQLAGVTPTDWAVSLPSNAATPTSFINAGLDHGLAPFPPMSLLAVGYNGASYGNFQGGGDKSSSFSIYADTSLLNLYIQDLSVGLSTADLAINADSATKFQFYAGTVSYAGPNTTGNRRTAYYGRNGVLTTAQKTNQTTTNAAQSVVPGLMRSPDRVQTGVATQTAMLIVHNVELSADEIALWYAWIRTYFTGRLSDNGL